MPCSLTSPRPLNVSIPTGFLHCLEAKVRLHGSFGTRVLCCLNGGLLTKSKGDCYLVVLFDRVLTWEGLSLFSCSALRTLFFTTSTAFPTTLVGDAQNTQWIQKVAQCYDDVRTAGFVVDSHSCYRSISNSTMRFGPTTISSAQLLQEWPAVVNSPAYATATAAIQATLRRGYNTLVARMTRWPLIPLPLEPEDPSKMHLAINLNFEQGHEVVHGRNAHTIGSFSTIKCSCKSKSHIVTNFPMRPCAISNVELAGYGVHAVTASAPALGLTLFGTAFDDQGTWTVCSPPTSLRESKPAPFQKFQQPTPIFQCTHGLLPKAPVSTPIS